MTTAVAAVLVLLVAMWHWRRKRPTNVLESLGRVESHREAWRSKH